jgi:hypothetical protein
MQAIKKAQFEPWKMRSGTELVVSQIDSGIQISTNRTGERDSANRTGDCMTHRWDLQKKTKNSSTLLRF